MIGDAPGDYKAAEANDALFFPINPGARRSQLEAAATTKGIDRFLAGTFAGEYQQQAARRVRHATCRSSRRGRRSRCSQADRTLIAISSYMTQVFDSNCTDILTHDNRNHG